MRYRTQMHFTLRAASTVTAMVAKIALLAALVLFAGCGPLTFVVGVTPGDQRLRETKVIEDGRRRSVKIAVVDVTGLIINADRPGLLQAGTNPVSDLAEQLQAARSDASVVAVVLRINSPGGGVTASDIMYREVMRFRSETRKPVVALMQDVAASGGYYLACSADHIVAHPTTVTGSIGVIIQTVSLGPALARIGIETDAITSGPLKDAANPLGSLTDPQRAVLQGLVNDFYEQFLDVVRTSRPALDDTRLRELADGRVMSGSAAADAGLVDETGDLYTAVAAARRLAGVERSDVVLFHRPLDYVASPYAVAGPADGGGVASPGNVQVNMLQLNLPGNSPSLGLPQGFYYLWQP